MKQDQRKSQRISEFMPVSMFLRNAGGEVLAGPIAGKIIDISRDGACLLMTQVQSGPWHVFHSPQKDGTLSLQLVVNRPEQGVNLDISARPVWLNTFERDEFQERIMGVTFLQPEKARDWGIVPSPSRTP